ncbi:rhomboid protease GluP [archaeon BMS3Bbin16]|nr:rhomboid protease GluP [archaeon BMS3Bbin16]
MSRDESRPIVTYALLTVNILFYIYLAIQSRNILVIDTGLMERYGFVTERFLGGAYYQIVTNMFTHFDFPHLGYNMLFLAFFGSKAEALFGRSRTLLFYLLFGLATTSVSFLYPLDTISAGSSGAIYGLLGADLSAQRGVYTNGIWSSMLYGFVFFFLAAATGFLAHLIGLIIGFIAGYLASRDWYLEEEGAEDEFKDIEV